MVTLSEVRPRVAAVPFPVEAELMRVGIHGERLHVVLGVASPSEEDERVPAIEEWRTEIVLSGPVSVAVAPVVGIAARQRISHPESAIVTDGVGFGCGPLHVEQVFRPRVGVGHISRVCQRVARIDIHVSHIGLSAIGMIDDHVVGTTHEHLRLAVAVPVVAHDVVLLIRSGAHVGSQVDIPQSVALDVVALQEVVCRVVGHGTRPSGVAVEVVVALHQEFRHPVAVDIGQCDIVDAVVAGDVSTPSRQDGFDSELHVLGRHSAYGRAFFLFDPFDDSRHLVRSPR